MGCDFTLWRMSFCFVLFLRATPAAFGSSLARGQIGATAAGLHHSHSNMGSKLHLWSTSQLMEMPDPQPWARPRIELSMSQILVGFVSAMPQWELLRIFFFFGLLSFFRAAPLTYGGFQAGGQIRAIAAGRHHSHSNLGSELHLQPTPTLDP